MNVEIRPEPTDDERAAILKALDLGEQAPPPPPPPQDEDAP
jgi:hypothetical protein